MLNIDSISNNEHPYNVGETMPEESKKRGRRRAPAIATFNQVWLLYPRLTSNSFHRPSVLTVNYGPSFFPSIYGPNVKRAGYKLREKNEIFII